VQASGSPTPGTPDTEAAGGDTAADENAGNDEAN
jgi:hypothetical protein